MKRIMMKSKIHRATVTEADLDYEGSITIDTELMKAADMLPYEKVDVLDITNGAVIDRNDAEGHWLQLNGPAFGWWPISNETWHWEFRGT